MGGQTEVDACVLGQLLRRTRLSPIVEVGRRCHHRYAEVAPDAHGDHIPVDLPTEPHTGIVPLGDDVGEIIVVDESRR